MIRVLLADDHVMVREGLRQLLELDEEIEVIGEAGNGYQCLDAVSRFIPDVLLLDINMPDIDGIKVTAMIREHDNKCKIIMLTIHKEVEYLINALDSGCDGYVLKDSDSSTLISAIKSVYAGESFVEPSLATVLNENLVEREINKSKVDELSKREIEVLKLIAKGQFNKEIAAELGISERTVKNHISSIFKKISVSDRTQAAVFAIRNNIVDIR